MTRALFGIATDASVSDSVKLAAIRDALDRARLNPKTAAEVDQHKPYEQIVDSLAAIEGGSPPAQLRPMLKSGGSPPCRIKRDTPQVEPLRLASEPIPHHTRDMFGR
jgi:hypothetical protein